MTAIVLIALALYLLSLRTTPTTTPTAGPGLSPSAPQSPEILDTGFTPAMFACGSPRLVPSVVQTLGRSTTGNPPTGPQNFARETAEVGSRALGVACVTDPSGAIFQVFFDEAGRVVGFR